jgi:hypothetical protein
VRHPVLIISERRRHSVLRNLAWILLLCGVVWGQPTSAETFGFTAKEFRDRFDRELAKDKAEQLAACKKLGQSVIVSRHSGSSTVVVCHVDPP